MRLKDEKDDLADEPLPIEVVHDSAGNPSETTDPKELIKERLERDVGHRNGVEDIYYDNSWNTFISQISRVSSLFGFGEFKLGYIDKSETGDFFIIPGEKTIVIEVNSKCPRDKIIQSIAN